MDAIAGFHEMKAFFALLGIPLAVLLLGSAAAKLRVGPASNAALDSALARFVPIPWAFKLAWWGISVIEICLAVALTLRPMLGGALAAAFFSCAAGYSIAAGIIAPGRPCGCFGMEGKAVSTLSVGRALLLALAGAGYSQNGAGALSALGDPRAWAGLLGLLALSPFLLPELAALLRSSIVKRRSRGCARASSDLSLMLHVLARTSAWKMMAPYRAGSAGPDAWREGCWQFLSFSASADQAMATIVFAVMLPAAGSTCRAMLRRGLAGAPIVVAPDERVRWPLRERVRALKLALTS
jgi:hypothetical protein